MGSNLHRKYSMGLARGLHRDEPMASRGGEEMLPENVREALGRAESVLEGLVETAEDGVFLSDGSRLLDCNPAMVRLLGYASREALLGRDPFEAAPAEQPDGTRSTESASRFVQGALAGTPARFEWRYRRADHSDLDVEVRLNRCFVGGMPFLLGVARELGASKIEQGLCARLIDSLPGSFFLFDSHLRLRRWNKNAERRSGYTADELRGKSANELLGSEEDRKRVVEAASRALADSRATEYVEARVRWKDGTRVPSLLSGARVDAPEGPMLIGVVVDISARVRAEEALAASEQNYRRLFDATDALLVVDESGNVLDLNEAARTLFGIGRTTSRSLSIDDLSLEEPPYSRPEAREWFRRTLEDGPQVFEWRCRRGDGTLFWAEVSLRSFSPGDSQRLIAFVHDVTESKRAALERERLIAEAQAANSAKDQFLAVLSHELRNPLAAIQAGADLLRHISENDPRTQRAVDVIHRNVKLQAKLVEGLLDMSRLARGKLTIERAPVALDQVAVSAVQACRADAARAGVSLEVQAESGAWVQGDAERLEQVVVHLVDNGIKFTPKGGRVAVSVAVENDRGHLVVEDSGIGIEAERIPELFEMFRRGPDAPRRAAGLGIGLSLVKSVTELHGGRVWVESAGRGHGSRFIVELPLSEPAATAGAPAAAPPGVPALKMLLLEDNADTRSLLSETFARLAYDVVATESAEAALDVLSRQSVDVILADIGLPGMNGYDFLRRARELPSAAHTPAFALTGFGTSEDVNRARAAGYVEHVTKPVDAAAIDRRIRARVTSPPGASGGAHGSLPSGP
jgi:PAS domain S-box-containing protein